MITVIYQLLTYKAKLYEQAKKLNVTIPLNTDTRSN